MQGCRVRVSLAIIWIPPVLAAVAAECRAGTQAQVELDPPPARLE